MLCPSLTAATMAASRSIPACAGEPRFLSSCSWASRVYPRVCGGTDHTDFRQQSARVRSIPACAGEPDSASTTRQGSEGLSPRVRGNHRNTRISLTPTPKGSIPACAGEPQAFSSPVNSGRGSIPACAGEPRSQRARRKSAGRRVYPRVCGGTGSLRSSSIRLTTYGSIPACAGEPPRDVLGAFQIGPRVYPRVCGGTRPTCSRPHWLMGLSPRVRGNRALRVACNVFQRSIPACAGEPRALKRSGHGSAWVYPRVCGGTHAICCAAVQVPGLSPRVRGNLPGIHRPREGLRYYPRVCGGTALVSLILGIAQGLSPRVRGNPAHLSR